MKDNGKRGRDAKLYVYKKHRAHDKAVAKIMDDVSDYVEIGEHVDLAFCIVAVVPIEVFLKDEKYHETHDHIKKQPDGIAHIFHRFGKYVEKGAAYQSAGGKGNEEDKDVFQHPIIEYQGKYPDKGDKA